LGGCASESTVDHDALPSFAVGERVQFHRSDSLAQPFHSIVVGDYLVVLEQSPGPALHVLDRFDGTLIESYGGRGEGPGEFEMPWSIDRDPAGDAIWIFDPDLGRLTRIELSLLRLNPDSVGPFVLNLRTQSPIGGPVWTSQGTLISSGAYEDYRFAVVDSAGNEIGQVGPLPPGDPDISVRFRNLIHQGTPATNPDHNRFVIGSRHVPRIEAFDQQGRSVAIAQAPFEWDLTAQDLPFVDRFAVGDDWKAGYVAVAASKRRFFGLFSGRTYEDSADRKYFGRFVHVFNWDGRFVGYIALEVDARDISVDPDGSTLYVLEWDPVPTVGAYELLQDEPAVR
jgi:hypothetical protein